ncbi:hypothetical protein Tco_1301793 [Tanacetum coccineum]
MALLGTQIQKRCYSKPTNHNLWITSAPTAQYKRLEKIEAFEAKHMGATEASGDYTQLNKAFLNKSVDPDHSTMLQSYALLQAKKDKNACLEKKIHDMLHEEKSERPLALKHES